MLEIELKQPHLSDSKSVDLDLSNGLFNKSVSHHRYGYDPHHPRGFK